jgi:hypothetical protein
VGTDVRGLKGKDDTALSVFDEGCFDCVVVIVFGRHRGNQRTSGSIVLQRLGFAMVIDRGGADSFGEAMVYDRP